MKVLIFCAGGSAKWGYYLGIPKPLILLNKESILGRTLRLLKKQKVKDITIVATDPILKQQGYDFFEPQASRWFVETLISTEKLWDEHTVVLMGDVFYTPEALKTILSPNNSSIKFYGRAGKSLFSHKAHGELFGISFSKNDSALIHEHAQKVIKAAKSMGHGKAWQFYRSIAGFELDQKKTEEKYFVEIDDFTDDFDTPEEYDLAVFRYSLVASKNPMKQALLWLWVKVLDPLSIKFFGKPLYA